MYLHPRAKALRYQALYFHTTTRVVYNLLTVHMLTLYLLPDRVGPGSQDVAATNIIVLHHLSLCDHL